MKTPMRMFFLAVMMAFVAASCTKEVKVALSETALTMAPGGDTVEIALTSNGDWTVSLADEWLGVSPLSGSGDATLTLVAPANVAAENRTTTLEASTKDQKATLVVTQNANANFIMVSPTTIECSHEGGEFAVEVSTDMEWSVANLPEWISCQPSSGTNSATLTLTVSAWESEIRPRQATITIGSDTLSATVSVKQNAQPSQLISVTPDRIEFDCASATQTLSVTCMGAWSVQQDGDWATLSAMSGQGDAEIQLSVPENTELTERTCSFTFVSEYGTEARVKVMQMGIPDPHFLTVTPMDETVAGEGGGFEVTVECDTDWTAAANDDWIALATAEGNGNGTFSVEVTPNPLFTPRDARIDVISGNLVRRITVRQEGVGQEAYVHVSPNTLSVAQLGGVSTLQITANVRWTLVASSWITLLSPSGTADGSCGVAVDANNTYETRTGYIKAYYGNELMEEVVVTQEGIALTLETDMTEINANAQSSRYIINVTSNQSWTVECEAAWIVIGRNRENGKFAIGVTENTTSSPRDAEVKVIGRIGGERIIPVHQSAD